MTIEKYIKATTRKYIKGIVGEYRVSTLLNQLNTRDYLILNNIMLNIDGTSTQIDHIVISIYGIFVIETKNYSGKIYGTETNSNWKQYIYGKEGIIYNPTRQNYKHILAIQDKLPEQLKNTKIIPIITFPDSTIVKVTAKNTHIINNNQLLNVISNYREKLYSYNDIYTIKYYIETNNATGIINNVKHVIKVKRHIHSKRAML